MKRLLTIDELNKAKSPKSILTALSFGISVIENKNSWRRTVNCMCKCGNLKTLTATLFKSGAVKSCGCLNIGQPVKHGLSKRGNVSTIYHVWANIKSRCNLKLNHPRKDRYSKRGIKMCAEWANDFKAFYDWCIANGWQKGLQIDRINNDGDYKPENCRIVTNTINGRNKGNTMFLEYDGKNLPITEWCEILNINAHTVRYRVHKGLSAKEALSTKRLPRRTNELINQTKNQYYTQ